MQEFEPLAGKIGLLGRQSSDVATGARQIFDYVTSDGVDPHWEDDGDDRCLLLYRGYSGSVCDNHVHLEADKFAGKLGDPLRAPLRPAIFDSDGAPLDPTECTQSLDKGNSP